MCEVLSCEVVSCEVVSCEVVSCEVVSCEIVFCEALPCEEFVVRNSCHPEFYFSECCRTDSFVRQTLWGKLSFQLRADHIFPRPPVPPDMQYIRLAADLAVFHITLFAPGRSINCGLIRLSTPGTLKSTDHANIYRTSWLG